MVRFVQILSNIFCQIFKIVSKIQNCVQKIFFEMLTQFWIFDEILIFDNMLNFCHNVPIFVFYSKCELSHFANQLSHFFQIGTFFENVTINYEVMWREVMWQAYSDRNVNWHISPKMYQCTNHITPQNFAKNSKFWSKIQNFVKKWEGKQHIRRFDQWLNYKQFF